MSCTSATSEEINNTMVEFLSSMMLCASDNNMVAVTAMNKGFHSVTEHASIIDVIELMKQGQLPTTYKLLLL